MTTTLLDARQAISGGRWTGNLINQHYFDSLNVFYAVVPNSPVTVLASQDLSAAAIQSFPLVSYDTPTIEQALHETMDRDSPWFRVDEFVRVLDAADKSRNNGKYKIIVNNLRIDPAYMIRLYARPLNLQALKTCADRGSPMCIEAMERIYQTFTTLRRDLGPDVAGDMFDSLVRAELDRIALSPLSAQILSSARI